MRLELKFGQWLLIVQQSPKGLGGRVRIRTAMPPYSKRTQYG